MELKDRVVLYVELTEEEYEALKDRAKKEGFQSTTEYIKAIIVKGTANNEPKADIKEVAEAISKKVERTVMDILNPFTGKIDEVAKKVAELREIVEAKQAAPIIKAPPPVLAVGEAEPKKNGGEKQQKMSAIEWLKKYKVSFGEDISKKMQSPDALFEKLRREGAIVVEAMGEKIAIEREFWEQFTKELQAISVKSVDEVSKLISSYLGDRAGRLVKKLAKAGLIVYDEDKGEWIINVKVEQQQQ